MCKLWMTAAVALIALQAPKANAASVTFELSSIDGCPTCIFPSASFELVTTPEGGDKYLVTSVIGDVGGFPLTLLPPNSFQKNDNLLFYPSLPIFDQHGISFLLDGADVNEACYSTTFCSVNYYDPNAPLNYIHPATGTLTPTPLPAALPLFATGLAVTGLLGWRKKRKAAAALAAA